MSALNLPQDVEAVIRHFYTCEFTTVNRQGQPMTWPSVPYFDAAEGRIVRRLFIWYLFQRISLTVTPRRMLVWRGGDFSSAPETIELDHVG